MSMVRVSGVVKGERVREGTSERGPWKIREVRVLIADLDFTDVLIEDGVPFPPHGMEVDWLCDVKPGRFLRVEFVSDYPAPSAVRKAS